ncbi:MAG: hypothetical protein LLG04_03520 [Parachlamydia sp.]|nr:hypothetical protein [Parachlamydia sp.]
MAGSEVHLFTRNPANNVWAHALDGIAACTAKKLSSRDKINLLVLPVLLGIATVATALTTLPLMVPIGLGLGALAGTSYAVYRYYQSRTTTAEKALKSMCRGDFGSAAALFKSMLKSQFGTMTGAKLRAVNGDRKAKKLPLINNVQDMLQPRYRNSFNFANVRNHHDWLIFGELYGSCMLFQLSQAIGKKKIAENEVKERLNQAKFWMSQSKFENWHADLPRAIEAAARQGSNPPQVPQPSMAKSGAVALLKVVDSLQRIDSSSWHKEPSLHSQKFLDSLKPWISRSSVGPQGYQLYLRLATCRNAEEMKPKAQSVSQAVIDKLESKINQK